MNHLFPVSALLLGSLAFAQAADLSGKVTLDGTPPPEVTIQFTPDCAKMHDKPVTTCWYVVGKDHGLGDVFVYVKSGLTQKNFPIPTTEPMIEQKGCMYHPYVTGLMVGQKLRIKNADPVLHNVHAMQDTGGTEYFNNPQPQGFPDLEETFSKPQVMVKLKCDVHPWMFAYVGVVDNPYFAVTDQDGNYTIKGLPDGNYTVVAYHEKTHRGTPGISKEVEVKGNTTLNFTVELPKK